MKSLTYWIKSTSVKRYGFRQIILNKGIEMLMHFGSLNADM
jgi:hypothetical protein